MTREDFADFGIRHFTAWEVEKTGARLSDVRARLMQHLEHFRHEIGQPVFLQKNGLTSGTHSCQLHALGEAADIYLNEFEPHAVLKAALEADFKGIGLYVTESRGWVGAHLDLRADFGFWVGVKKCRQRNWVYKGLILEPQNYL